MRHGSPPPIPPRRFKVDASRQHTDSLPSSSGIDHFSSELSCCSDDGKNGIDYKSYAITALTKPTSFATPLAIPDINWRRDSLNQLMNPRQPILNRAVSLNAGQFITNFELVDELRSR